MYPLVVTVLGTVLAFGVCVRWSLPPTWPQRVRPVAGVAIGPLVATELLWFRDGSLVGFLLLGLLTVAVLETYARAHTVADRLDRAVEAVANGIGRVVTLAATTVVWALFILPVSVVSRLFRYSPIDGGWTDPVSAWVEVDPDRLRSPDGSPARPSRMGVLELRPTKGVRRRGHLRLAVPLLAVAVLAVVKLPVQLDMPSFGSDGAATGTVVRQDTFTKEFEDDAAFQDAPWAKNLRLSLTDAWNNLEFNAALGGWQIKDVTSDYINVEDGERVTVAPDPALGDPVVVWFLGGSAAFGAGQRDEHTIPSELVRRAGADGIPLEIHNLAVPATVNWQTAMLLIARLQWEDPPDLVVVYDGANDLALQDILAGQGKGRSDEPAPLIDGELDTILRERANAREGSSADVPSIAPTTPDEPLDPASSGALVSSRYLKGVEVIRQYCTARSVPVSVFWQPEIRTKQPLSEADRTTLADVNVDDATVARWQPFSAAARAGLPAAGVTDLTGVFDQVTEPIYWDTVHTNETGARLVADAIYDGLAPMLQRLAGGD